MPSPTIRALAAEAVETAAQLLASSMRDNPLHRAVFGEAESRLEPLLERAFVRLLQRQMRTGLVLAAHDDGALIGVAAMVRPGCCQPDLREQLAMFGILARSRALGRLPRILWWLRIWAARDPRFPHWHLGPAAVVRARQGQGIGTALMAAVCEELDRHGGIGYLETDKQENVRLYRRGGFEVLAMRPILGVPNWFMLRRPQRRDAA